MTALRYRRHLSRQLQVSEVDPHRKFIKVISKNSSHEVHIKQSNPLFIRCCLHDVWGKYSHVMSEIISPIIFLRKLIQSELDYCQLSRLNNRMSGFEVHRCSRHTVLLILRELVNKMFNSWIDLSTAAAGKIHQLFPGGWIWS